jgi:glycosyltransferase involved in cell wall biosynthesis
LKTIALVDSYQGGHHLTYLRLFSKTLLDLGYQVMTFSPEPAQVSEWIACHCPQQDKRLYPFQIQEPKIPNLPIVGKLPQPLVVLARWQYATKVIGNAASEIKQSPDLVFFNWLDNYFSYYLTDRIVDRVFPYSWSGLYFFPDRLRSGQRFLPILRTPLTHAAVARSSRCRGVGVLVETMAHELQNQLKHPVMAFPDLTDESTPDSNYPLAKHIREKASDRKIIGLIGSLSKRKGLFTLLETAQKAREENWFFVFVGQLSKLSANDDGRLQEIVRSQLSNCFFHFERIPEESQFNALIDVCDVLFAAYENFPYSSNILTKAAVFRKPVIVSDGFCMSERVQQFQMGLSIPQGDVSQCIEAIRCLCQPSAPNSHQLKFNFESYQSYHSMERLYRVFKEILKINEY